MTPTYGDPTLRVDQPTSSSTIHELTPQHRPTGGNLTRPQRPERAIPHPTPTKPPSTPKNQNEATP